MRMSVVEMELCGGQNVHHRANHTLFVSYGHPCWFEIYLVPVTYYPVLMGWRLGHPAATAASPPSVTLVQPPRLRCWRLGHPAAYNVEQMDLINTYGLTLGGWGADKQHGCATVVHSMQSPVQQ